MNLITATLESVKLSLRVDHNFDDELITALLETAKSYLKDAIDSNNTDGTIEGYKQYDWAVSLLTQHWYEGRSKHLKSIFPQLYKRYYSR